MLADLLDISAVESGDEPVAIEDVKKQMEHTDSDDDAHIDSLVKEARRDVENYTRRSLLSKTLTASYAYGKRFRLHQPPLGDVESVSTFYQGTETEEDLTKFYVRTSLIPELRLKTNKFYSASRIDEIRIVYTVGGSAPDQIKRAIIQRAAELFEYRFPREVGTVFTGELEGGNWKKTLDNSGLVIPRI